MFDEVFFFQVKLQKRFFEIFQREQFKNSAVASNNTKRDFVILQQDFMDMDTEYFFHSANSLTLHCMHKQSFIAIIYPR